MRPLGHPARLLALVLGVGLLVATPTSAEASATANRSAYDVIASADLAGGGFSGTKVSAGAVVLGSTPSSVTAYGKPALRGTYTTPWVTPATPFAQLVPSWSATTPAGSWVVVAVEVSTGDAGAGRTSSWDTVARWSTREDQVHRSSYSAQTDDLAKMSVDTVLSQVGQLHAWRLKVSLYERPGTSSPALRQVGAVATVPGSGTPATSKPLYAAKAVLDVPSYSQMKHRGEYPQYGGGGEAWCSPTSLAMILGYYGRLPAKADYAWVKSSYADRWVDQVARETYDARYEGTGNWPFNTAYGADRAGDGFVTRLPDLRDAERFVHAGIPLAASISFAKGQLSGAPISATNGHLVVIVGFTAKGDVVVNDPAASSNGSVRRTYDRGQFERAWMRRSLGTVYVVRDADHPLPKTSSAAW